MVIVVICFLLAINDYKNSYNPKNIDTVDSFIRIALVTDPLEGNNQFIMQAYNEHRIHSAEWDHLASSCYHNHRF